MTEENAAPWALRQVWQWQCTIGPGLTSTWYPTFPQRQLPSITSSLPLNRPRRLAGISIDDAVHVDIKNVLHRSSTSRSPLSSSSTTRAQRSSIKAASARLVVLPHRSQRNANLFGRRRVRKSSSLLTSTYPSFSASAAISASPEAPKPRSKTCAASNPLASNQRTRPGGNCASISYFIPPR